MNDNYYTRSFSDDLDSDEKDEASKEGPEYSFQGYSIDFNEKIMLTPVDDRPKK